MLLIEVFLPLELVVLIVFVSVAVVVLVLVIVMTLVLSHCLQAAYMYQYQHVLSDASVFTRFGLPAICANRTCHATELPMAFQFSFNPASAGANVTLTPDEVALEKTFSSASSMPRNSRLLLSACFVFACVSPCLRPVPRLCLS